MAVQQYTKASIAKLDFVIRQIDTIAASEFSHEDAPKALGELKALFERDRRRISGLPASADEAMTRAVCTQANKDIARFLPILGFIQRSSNVRNAFEFFDPILRLAKSLIGPDAKLIFSSEWFFSPLTYALVFSELPNFVFIGMPASESGNSLVIPLAGHELGHSVWKQNNLDTYFKAGVTDLTLRQYRASWTEFCRIFGRHDEKNLETDLMLLQIWSNTHRLAMAQCQEVFCDFIGIRLFGESYFHSFEYLLAPSLGGARSVRYPSMVDRAKHMEEAARHFGVAVPANYSKSFYEPGLNLSRSDKFYVESADAVTAGMVQTLIQKCTEICDKAQLQARDDTLVGEAFKKFSNGIPVEGKQGLADIINAGWRIYLDDNAWTDQGLDPFSKVNALNEIVFKSIEIMEYRERLQGGP